jgi:hypothetical protein
VNETKLVSNKDDLKYMPAQILWAFQTSWVLVPNYHHVISRSKNENIPTLRNTYSCCCLNSQLLSTKIKELCPTKHLTYTILLTLLSFAYFLNIDWKIVNLEHRTEICINMYCVTKMDSLNICKLKCYKYQHKYQSRFAKRRVPNLSPTKPNLPPPIQRYNWPE